MTDSGVEFPLDFSAITEELKRQSKELGAADKQLDAFQAKSAEFTRKKDGIARQMQRQQERAFMGAVRRAGTSLAAKPGNDAAIWSAKAAELEADINRRKEAKESAFWDDKVGAARSDAFQASRGAGVPGAGRSARAETNAAQAAESLAAKLVRLGGSAAVLTATVNTLSSGMERANANSAQSHRDLGGMNLVIGQAAARLGIKEDTLRHAVINSPDRQGALGLLRSATTDSTINGRRYRPSDIQAALEAGARTGDYATASTLLQQGQIPRLSSMRTTSDASDELFQRSQENLRDQKRLETMAPNSAARDREKLLEQFKAANPTLGMVADYIPFSTPIIGGALQTYEYTHGSSPRPEAPNVAPIGGGQRGPAPTVPAGIPMGSRYDPTADLAGAIRDLAGRINQLPAKTPNVNSGQTGGGMQ